MFCKIWQTITRFRHEISIDLDISLRGCNGECVEYCAINHVKLVESKRLEKKHDCSTQKERSFSEVKARISSTINIPYTHCNNFFLFCDIEKYRTFHQKT